MKSIEPTLRRPKRARPSAKERSQVPINQGIQRIETAMLKVEMGREVGEGGSKKHKGVLQAKMQTSENAKKKAATPD
jgi:hypothetical protein